jgi:hypothetical protein
MILNGSWKAPRCSRVLHSAGRLLKTCDGMKKGCIFCIGELQRSFFPSCRQDVAEKVKDPFRPQNIL